MYLEHFGLKAKPFSLNPDPSYLFFSSQHSLAYHMLEYGLLSQEGITVISGEVGAGKTTLLRHLLNQHAEDELRIGLIADTEKDTAKQLMNWIAMAFDLDHSGDKIELKKRFQNFLIQNYAQGRTAVLIVDEAQNLGKKALEQLRLLNNINSGDDELLKIILVGQPQLLKKLQSPQLQQLAQRVTVEFHLEPLDAKATLGYIRHRLKVAGGKHYLFGNAAMHAIFYLSGGVPRLINTLCDYALVHGFSTGRKRIRVEAVMDVARSRKIGGINQLREETEEMAKARSYIFSETGHDVGVARGNAPMESLPPGLS
jgi:type II secretory pathway predicted ATPase ExeA